MCISKPKMNNQIVKLSLQSFRKKKLKNIIHFIKNQSMNSDYTIKSCVFFKRKVFKKFTVISGPHVHKKSRKQYVIFRYKALVSFIFKKDVNKIYNLKSQIIDNKLDEGIDLSFEFNKLKTIRILFSKKELIKNFLSKNSKRLSEIK